MRIFVHCTLKISGVVRKPAFCICANKDADQLRGNREADQRLCFRYLNRTIPLLPKSERGGGVGSTLYEIHRVLPTHRFS